MQIFYQIGFLSKCVINSNAGSSSSYTNDSIVLESFGFRLDLFLNIWHTVEQQSVVASNPLSC